MRMMNHSVVVMMMWQLLDDEGEDVSIITRVKMRSKVKPCGDEDDDEKSVSGEDDGGKGDDTEDDEDDVAAP